MPTLLVGFVSLLVGCIGYLSMISTTAEAVALARLILTHGGLAEDSLARHFMPVRAFGMAPWGPISFVVTSWIMEARAPKLLSHMATREEWYSSQILEHLRSDHQLRQVVICGAGYDTRAYRLDLPAGTIVFELDLTTHPGVQTTKRQRLSGAGVNADHARYLPIDFANEAVADVLKAGGHDASRPTLFIWEGVTMYLARSAIVDTVRSFRESSAAGSILLCELFDAAVLEPTARTHPVWGHHWRIIIRTGEAYRFALSPAEMEPFWRSLGTRPISHYKPDHQRRAWASMVSPAGGRTNMGWLLPRSASEGEPLGGLSHMFALRLR